MDVKDVSQDFYYAAIMKGSVAAAERAKLRKGHSVFDHPPPAHVIARFMRNRQDPTGDFGQGHPVVATSQVPAPYPPCTLPLRDLAPLSISEMRLETHHRGKVAFLRVLTPPSLITALMAIVEDERGTAVLLQLYHQLEQRVVPASEVLWKGRVCAVKEPFFKCATDGTYSVRVDHVSDIVWLEDSDELVPQKWRQPALAPGGSKSTREKGNEAVKGGRWAEAERLYTSAIKAAETPEESHLAHLNRSYTNLQLHRPEKALHDATSGSDPASPSEKRLFREARALYDQSRFKASMEKLLALMASHPDNKNAAAEMGRAKARLAEERTGEYDFGRMYKQAEKTPPIIDCATFSRPVEVRESPGRGRGLFTTVPVSAGQLLLCEKAFGYSYADEKHFSVLMNVITKRVTVGGQAGLLTQIVQMLYHGHCQSREFVELFCGDYTPVSVSEADETPVVDTFLVEKIISQNAFGTPRTSHASHITSMSEETNTKSDAHTTCGIWLLASRINHSCAGNCRRSFIGDMQIVRATTDIPAGTELLFAYRALLPMELYAKVQQGLASWGFVCGCALCEDRKATRDALLKRRETLFRLLVKALNGPGPVNTAKARAILENMGETYPSTNTSPVRLELWDAYFALGDHLLRNRSLTDAVKMFARGFEALGYSITAPLPGANTKAAFEVKRWGIANDMVPWAFSRLFEVYNELAPERCGRIRQYAGVAYSIIVGEGVTMGGVFPELA